MVNWREALFTFGVLALPSSARTPTNYAKLGEAFDFFRTRNAND